MSQTAIDRDLELLKKSVLEQPYDSSTRDALIARYDRVTPGGFVIVDDYRAIPQCKSAVDDFRAERGITGSIEIVDRTGFDWRKSHAEPASAAPPV